MPRCDSVCFSYSRTAFCMCSERAFSRTDDKWFPLGEVEEFQTRLPLVAYSSHPTVKSYQLWVCALPLKSHGNDHTAPAHTVHLVWGFEGFVFCLVHSISSLSISVPLFHRRDPLKMCNPMIDYVFSRNPNRLLGKGRAVCWLLW